jgi:2'-5' RNA ligase
MRLFLGIRLSPELVETLVTCRQAALDVDPSWRAEKWVAPENLHVTLRFLGEVGEGAVSQLTELLAPTISCMPPYTLSLSRAAATPGPRAASLIWVQASDGAHQTAAVAAALNHALVQVGISEERRAFKTHVTLCRTRRPRSASHSLLGAVDAVLAVAQTSQRTMSVHSITLYSSTLTRTGPVYEELRIFGLSSD